MHGNCATEMLRVLCAFILYFSKGFTFVLVLLPSWYLFCPCQWSFSVWGDRSAEGSPHRKHASLLQPRWNVHQHQLRHRRCCCHTWKLMRKEKLWHNIEWNIGASGGKTPSKDSWDHISVCVNLFFWDMWMNSYWVVEKLSCEWCHEYESLLTPGDDCFRFLHFFQISFLPIFCICETAGSSRRLWSMVTFP